MITKNKFLSKTPGTQGSVLIASLWTLSVFSIFISSVAFQAGQQAVLLKRETQNFESRAEFMTAVNLLGQMILEDAAPAEDSPLDDWYGKVKSPDFEDRHMTVTVQDEESRIDINKAPQALLESLFKTVNDSGANLKGEAKDFSKAILKLRGDGKILSLEELYLLEDVEAEDIEKLRPYMTVYTEFPGLNINTADMLVLEAFIQSLPASDFSKKDLVEALKKYRNTVDASGQKGVFLNEELASDFFLQKLHLTSNVSMVQMASQLLPYMTTDSRSWHLTMVSSSGRTAETVLREKNTNMNFEILTWREY